MKSNYHTHVVLCGHAVGMTEDYVKEAIKLGYKSLGMSDHGPIGKNMMSPEEYEFNWLERQMTYDEFLNVYLKDVELSKQKYKNDINIYTGLEIEYLEEYHDYFKGLREKLDYMNLATHYFIYNDKMYNSFEHVNNNNVIGYALNSKKSMETGLYDIMVHPDVFMYHYKNADQKNLWDDNCSKAASIIIESAIENDVYLEINCGGLFKVTSADEVPGEYGYPRREFWEIASKYPDLKVVIGVDAHDPKQLGSNEINIAKSFASKLGIQVQEYCFNIEKRRSK